MIRFVPILFLSCIFTTASADIRLPSVIGNHMVLQRNSSVKLWGWGDPHEKVVISSSWKEQKDSTVVDGNAKWEIIIPTAQAGGPILLRSGAVILFCCRISLLVKYGFVQASQIWK